MRRISLQVILMLLVASLAWVYGCATQKSALKVQNRVPQEELAYFSDTFDELRYDLWDKAGKTYNESQLANFKLADMDVDEKGRLRIETKTGHFSKAGLASRFTIRGDFDIQLDCYLDFLKHASGMDQVMQFAVFSEIVGESKGYYLAIGLTKRAERNSVLYATYYKDGKALSRKWRPNSDFRGTLRIVRLGDRITTLYQKQGALGWQDLLTCRATSKDLMIGFTLQNFVGSRTSIKAEFPIVGMFDNFKVNAAQQIIESEI